MRIAPSGAPRRDLRGAAWIVVAFAVVLAGVAVVQIRAAWRAAASPAAPPPPLTGLRVDRDLVVASGLPRDGLAPLVDPPLLTPAGVDSLNRAVRGKYLTPDDRVIGVVVRGVARAYPLRVLDWHEVALDTLGGASLAVCWHPLSGAAACLDRRHGGGELDLAVSGLLYNSHHLLYDRGGESLWAPLLAQAVAGPAAGDTLALVPHALTSWAAWRAAHPATTVPEPADSLRLTYERSPYGSYEGSDLLRYPVAPLPPLAPGERLKDEVAGTRDAAGNWTVAAGEPALVHAYRFAWHAVVQNQRRRLK